MNRRTYASYSYTHMWNHVVLISLYTLSLDASLFLIYFIFFTSPPSSSYSFSIYFNTDINVYYVYLQIVIVCFPFIKKKTMKHFSIKTVHLHILFILFHFFIIQTSRCCFYFWELTKGKWLKNYNFLAQLAKKKLCMRCKWAKWRSGRGKKNQLIDGEKICKRKLSL